MKIRALRNKQGFTLIELMVVLVILGGLMGVLLVVLRDDRASRAKAEVELKVTYSKIQFALFEFKNKFGRYPTQDEGLEALVTQPPGLEGWSGPYMDKKYLLDPWKNKFKYVVEGSQVRIISLGADGREGGEKDDADIDLSTLMER
ncbi:MAG: type II secretion system major pseudopilin GspG [Turneriella sp.]|nr:type II secretion system major pseudopilin GspG [Turneriella sp.]